MGDRPMHVSNSFSHLNEDTNCCYSWKHTLNENRISAMIKTWSTSLEFPYRFCWSAKTAHIKFRSVGPHSFFGLVGATLAGVDRSDWEKSTKMCMMTVTISKPSIEKPIPFHVEKREDHLKNLNKANDKMLDQNMTTCYQIKGQFSASISIN